MASRSAVVSVPVVQTDTNKPIRTSASTYYGYTLYNHGPNAAVVRIYDNPSTSTGTLLDIVYIPAYVTVNAYYPVEDSTGGLLAKTGVLFWANPTTIEGSVRVD